MWRPICGLAWQMIWDKLRLPMTAVFSSKLDNKKERYLLVHAPPSPSAVWIEVLDAGTDILSRNLQSRKWTTVPWGGRGRVGPIKQNGLMCLRTWSMCFAVTWNPADLDIDKYLWSKVPAYIDWVVTYSIVSWESGDRACGFLYICLARGTYTYLSIEERIKLFSYPDQLVEFFFFVLN